MKKGRKTKTTRTQNNPALSNSEAILEALTLGQLDSVIDPKSGTSLVLKNAQESIRQGEAQVRSGEQALEIAKGYAEILIRTANAIVLVLNTQGIVQVINEAGAQITGYSIQELKGQNWFEMICPKDRYSQLWEEFNKIKSGNLPKNYQNSILTKSGEERHIVWQNSELLEGGKVAGSVSFGIDITEQKNIEKELRVSVNRFNLAVQASNEGLWEWDTHDKAYYSPRFKELLGYPESEVWEHISELKARLHPEDSDLTWAAAKRHFEEKVPFEIEYRLQHKSGEYRWFKAHAQAEWDADGKPVRFVGSIHDLTERKKAEEQYRQAQKMEAVGQLTGGIAHDFNNLLTVINGYSELSIPVLSPENPIRHNMEEILKAGLRAKALTNQLLMFSRRQVIAPKVVDLNVLILDLDKMMRRLIGADIELVVTLGEDLGLVKVDPSQMEQVLINLTVNARDAITENGKITIETRNLPAPKSEETGKGGGGDQIMLIVKDNGEGMSDEVKARLFEPFFTTKRVGAGTGLGLATCLSIIKQSRGVIRVVSEPGQGVSFEICLPRSREKAELLIAQKESRVLPRGTETILFVEDEAAVRKLAATILAGQGYKVLEAENGEVGLRMLEEAGKVDLAVTDVVMPRMGGREFVTQAKLISPGLKVMFISGYTSDPTIRSDVAASQTHYLQKPFTTKALIFKIRAALDHPTSSS